MVNIDGAEEETFVSCKSFFYDIPTQYMYFHIVICIKRKQIWLLYGSLSGRYSPTQIGVYVKGNNLSFSLSVGFR